MSPLLNCLFYYSICLVRASNLVLLRRHFNVKTKLTPEIIQAAEHIVRYGHGYEKVMLTKVT